MKRFDAFYREITEKYGFNHLPVLEGLSRGGLYVYNWAADNPGKVGAIYADNPVCDFKSWPGGKGTGPGSHDNWENLIKCYGFASEKEAMAWSKNPVDNMESIVSAGIPLIHIYGDADEVVPWEENTKVMIERVNALGGKIKIICKPGGKHHPHGPVNPADMAEWIIKNALTERH
jgi:alpha-beta hydrolase superfamily lysophospholipase